MQRERYIWSVFPSLAAWPALLMEPAPASLCIALLLVCMGGGEEEEEVWTQGPGGRMGLALIECPGVIAERRASASRATRHMARPGPCPPGKCCIITDSPKPRS